MAANKKVIEFSAGLLSGKKRSPARPFVAGLMAERPEDVSARMYRLLGTMNGMLVFLNKTPEEQAEHKAEPYRQAAAAALEEAKKTQAAFEARVAQQEAALAEAKRTLEAEAEARRTIETSGKTESTRLRAMLREADKDTQALTKKITTYESEIAQAHTQYQEKLSSYEKALAKKQPTKVVVEPPEKPEKIDFTYHRDINGRLLRVTLQADGYDDVDVSIVRGANGRMKHLKLGDTQ